MRGVKPHFDAREALALVLLVHFCAGCASDAPTATSSRTARQALVGEDPVPTVHLFENNSSALIAWRRAGVRERILVHFDGHFDFDWLPDETVARLAAATPSELADLELHPYAMDGGTLSGFGISNFIYPAARLGLVRELVWVVPDGTLPDQHTVHQSIREMLIRETQMIRVEEVRTIHFEQRAMRGEILGLPITICELADLPRFREPVLLDIDLDYFTTRSALTRYVTHRPWIMPEQVLRVLREKGLRTDLVTLSFSTIGGFLPPTARWLGRSLQQRLRFPRESAAGIAEERLQTERAEDTAGLALAARRYRRLVEQQPEDATLWFGLAEALETSGHIREAERARQRAASLDPLLEHGDLFVADRLWNNGGFEGALARYQRYLKKFPRGPFTAYAFRRKAGCLMRLGRAEEALGAFLRVVQVAPDHADSRFDLGILLRQRGAVDQALEQLRLARRILPEHGRYAMALGTTYILNGMLEEGVRELEFAVKRQPCSAAALGRLSEALLQLGRHEEAARHLRLALALQPNNPHMQAVARQLSRQGIRISEIGGP